MALRGKMQRLLKFRGSLAPVLTPYKSDGQVNPSAIETYVKKLKEYQVDGAYILGTTGDGLSLSHEDKLRLTESWIEARSKHYPELLAIINCSSTCVHDSQKLAAFAENLGADGVASLPPVYYKPKTASEMLTYLKSVSDAAPNTPFFYYHIPGFTQQLVDLQSIVRSAVEQIESFTGLKYSAGDMVVYSYLTQEFGDRVKVICGPSEALLALAATGGCDMAICATFNVKGAAEAHKAILKAIHDDGDVVKARAAHDRIMQICKDLKAGNMLKKVRKQFNEENKGQLDLGPPRLPLI